MQRIEIVRDWCSRFPKTSTMMLARAIYDKYPMLFPSLDACRSSVRSVRGNHGTFNRKNYAVKELYRPNQQSTSAHWAFPESKAEHWRPFKIDAEKTLILADAHIPFHDTKAINAVIDYGVKLNPDCILLNGDIVDFYSISRFLKSPDKTHLLEEITLTRQFLGWLRAKFPKARIIYKFGNHDERFDHFIWLKAPELFELTDIRLPKILTQSSNDHDEIDGIEFITQQEKIQIGKLDILHGHELGKSTVIQPVNIARGVFLKTIENTLVSHWHRASFHKERSSKDKVVGCWSTGCLCGLNPDYARLNKWNHGGAFVENKGGDFNVELLEILDGRIL